VCSVGCSKPPHGCCCIGLFSGAFYLPIAGGDPRLYRLKTSTKAKSGDCGRRETPLTYDRF